MGIQADTIIPEPGNPQALNRYSYVLNNPLKYTDPTGHFWWIAAGAFVGAAISYGSQVVGNLNEGMDLGAALTTNIDGGEIFLGAMTGASVVMAAPAVVALAGDALVGAGLLTGSTTVFSTGMSATSAAGVMATAVFGGQRQAASAGEQANQADNDFADIPCSFDADTPVITPSGTKSIQAIRPNDLVLAFSEATGITGVYTVTARFGHLDPFVLTLYLDNETIDTTPEHPFYTANHTWVEAGQLDVGDQIRRMDGSYGEIVRIELVARPEVMYNLTVAGAHTFFVGEEGWLVHNQCQPKTRPLNLAPEGSGRRGAFRQAKRDAGIPVSQQPDEMYTVPDRTNPGKTVREYYFGNQIIQDHRWGHSYLDDPMQNRGPHFNGPINGTHYDYILK